MKHVCKQCMKHVDGKELKSHSESHNRTNMYKQSVSEMFVEAKHTCPACGRQEGRITSKGLLCQWCSFLTQQYSEVG